MTMLGADETVKHMTFLSPFSPEQTDVFICPLSTKYRDRERTKDQITNILHDLVTARPGNYFIFFPSYQYMDMVYATFSAYFPKIETIIQTANMSEEDRMEFLNQFKIENQEPFIGFAVMGGIFSEG